MKKKLLIGFLLLFAISSTAYAGSMWGTYKGRPIVKVVVNGTEVQSAVPGQIIDGATMLPVRAISEAIGAKVDWNQQQSTATITTPPQAPQGLTLEQLNKIGESVGLVLQLNAAGQQIGTGSGFVVGSTFVTNYHVADGAAVSLKLDFGVKQVMVQVKDAVFSNPTADLIGFRVDGVPGLALQTDVPKKGDTVYSLGYPHHRFKITDGILVAYNPDKEIIHTARIESGSSGGVLANSDGEVIGITDGAVDSVNINTAIPASTLQKELDKVK